MANISPFLRMLLTKKRPDFAPVSPFPDEEPAPVESGPTIPIRAIPRAPDITPANPATLEQQPTEPTIPFGKVPSGQQPMTGPQPMGLPEPSSPTLPLKPQSRVEGAAETVRKYDQGLHPDPKTGEWVPHKRNKGLQILEGLGNYAASGIGLNLQGLLHPRGTPEQQARRALSTEIGLEDQGLQRRKAESDISRDTAYTDKLAREANAPEAPPDLTPQQKHEWDVLQEALKVHPQPFDDKDPRDLVLRQKLEAAGIPIPASYGKQPKTEPKLLASRTMQTPDGKNVYIDDDGEPVLNKSGEPIVHGVVKPDKESGETQEEADKREAERQSLKTASDTAKGYADHIDKSLLPSLYKQRGEVKAELDRTDWTKKAADEGEPVAKTRQEALTAQLAELKTQISGLEKDRNDHNSTAGSKAAEALKFERGSKPAANKPARPTKDGKYHYTLDQIRAKAESDGVSYAELLKVLRGNSKVVIDK